MRIIVGVFMATVLVGSTATFDVASVKPCFPNDNRQSRISGGPGSNDPERFSAVNFSLIGLLEYAYSLKQQQRSYPHWMDEASFDIAAKVPPGATLEESKIMLQSLLLERFDVKFHVENREMSVDELVIAKSGAKLKESTQPLDMRPVGQLNVGPDGYPVLPLGSRTMTQVAPSGKVAARVYGATANDIAVLFFNMRAAL